LTGKYVDGVPEGSRATLPGYEFLAPELTDADRNERVRRLVGVAERLGVSMSQLAIAWCVANPNVSSVITGASSVEQVRENMGALDALEQLSPEVLDEIKGVVKGPGAGR